MNEEIRRITAPQIKRPQGRRAHRRAHLVSRAHRGADRPPCRRNPGRRFARHGHARARDHGAGHARHDDPAGQGGDARLQARARGRRHAVRQLRGKSAEQAFRELRARAQGDPLRRDQARRRRAHGRHHPLPRRARRAGHGSRRADAAGDQHARLVPRAAAATRANGRRSSPTPRRWPRPARFPW